MGWFGRFVYQDGRWTGGAWTGALDVDEPRGVFLCVDVVDSDLATVDYSCTRCAGRFFLGHEPRHYFGRPKANPPVDPRAQADGLAAWAQDVLGRPVNTRRIRKLMASPSGGRPKDRQVETTVRRLLDEVGLPPPPGLPQP